MANEFRSAGNVTVNQLFLISYSDPSKVVDIRGNYVQIGFSESMLSPFLSGHVDITESSGLLYPSILERSSDGKPHVHGEEILFIEYTDHNNIARRETYFVYAIDEIKQDSGKETTLQYRLHFASLQKIISEQFIIQKTYRNMSYSEMVRDIFQEYYIDKVKPILDPLKKQVRGDISQYMQFYRGCEIEKTEERHTIVIPSLRPEKAIQYIMRKAYSENNSSSLFFFFETRSKFFFITHEQLVARNSVLATVQDFQFAVSLGGNDNTPAGQQKAKQTITKVGFPSMNSVDAIKKQAYVRSMGELDLLNRNVQLFYYDYKDQYLGYRNIDSNPQLVNSEKFISDALGDKRDIPDNWVFKDYLTPEEGNANRADNYDRNLPRYIETKTTKPIFEYHFVTNRITGEIPGRHFMSPGYIIKTIAPEYSLYSQVEQRDEDEYFAGTQMVVSVNSFISADDKWTTGIAFTKAGRGAGKHENRPGSAAGAELTSITPFEEDVDIETDTIPPFTPEPRIVPGTVSEREQQAMDFFVGRGYTPEQAAGIVANLTNESGMDVNSLNPNDAGSGKDSKGLAQWNRDRLDNLESFANARGAEIDYDRRGNPVVPFETQLEFVDHELRGTQVSNADGSSVGYTIEGAGAGSESGAYNRLVRSANSTQDSTVAMTYYERFGVGVNNYRNEMGSPYTRKRVSDGTRLITTYEQRTEGSA